MRIRHFGRLVLLAASILPLAGCRDSEPTSNLDQRFSQLELGMDTERVVAVMGAGGHHTKGPTEAVDRVVTDGGTKPFPKVTGYMHWGDNAPYVFVGLDYGKLAFAVLVKSDGSQRIGP